MPPSYSLSSPLSGEFREPQKIRYKIGQSQPLSSHSLKCVPSLTGTLTLGEKGFSEAAEFLAADPEMTVDNLQTLTYKACEPSKLYHHTLIAIYIRVNASYYLLLPSHRSISAALLPP